MIEEPEVDDNQFEKTEETGEAIEHGERQESKRNFGDGNQNAASRHAMEQINEQTEHNAASITTQSSMHNLSPPPEERDDDEEEEIEHALRSPETLGTLIEVRRSQGKGYGVFALQDLNAGSTVLSEAPLVKLIDDGSRTDPLDTAVNSLSPTSRKAYRNLHSYRRNKSESLNRSILYSNGFAIGTVATGVFELASRINHSCVPNTEFSWDAEKSRMVYVNRFEVLKGEEITIDYGHKKGYLKKYYGFECDCRGCTDWGSVMSSSDDVSDPRETLDLPNIDALLINDEPVRVTGGEKVD